MDRYDLLIVGIVVGFALGGFAGEFVAKRDFRTEAIQRGYAQFCPTNGIWAWIGECNE